MSETARFRSPSVGIDDWGDLDVDNIVDDLCSDFDTFYRQKVKSLIDETYALPPNGGFKLLLMAAIVAYARTLAPRLDPLEPSTGWRRDMHNAVAEFCNIIGFPPVPGDATPDVRATPLPTPAQPSPAPEDEPMSDVGDDSPATPSAAPALLPEVPPPHAPPAPIRVPLRPSALVAEPPAPSTGNPSGSTAPPRGGAAGKGKDKAEPQGAGVSKGKAQTGHVPPQTQKATYAAAAAAAPPSPPKPPRASLVISLPDAPSNASLFAQSATQADMMAMLCMETLASHPQYADVKVSAAKWTPKGNLVVFGGPDTPQDRLLATSHILTSAISSRLSVPGASRILARANVKWSKVLINGVLLYGAGPATSPAPSAALHALLVDNNPAYKALKITQMPSWVRAPATYQPTQEKSSLVVAFEDPDGSIARDLIKAKSLFVFGAQATVKKWKYKAPHPNQCIRRMVDARLAAQVMASNVTLPGRPRAQAPQPVPRGASELDDSAPVATGATSHHPPTPGPLSAPLIHDPPTDPIPPKAKRSKKRRA